MKDSYLKGKSIDNLLSLRRLSAATRTQYLNGLSQFLRYCRQEPDELVRNARKSPRTFERQFVAFLEKKGKETSPATVWLVRNSVKKFLDENGADSIKWKFVDDRIPSKKAHGEDRAPTIEEVRKIVSAADLRMKCVVLFLCSTGTRIGGLEHLKWRDIEEIDYNGTKFGKVTIYRGETEEYTTYTTPEAYEHLLEYRRLREVAGERTTQQSPVFVTRSNVDDFRPERVREISRSTMRNLMARLLRQVGIRTVIHEGKNARRYDIKQNHAFRKFFKTRMELSGVKPIITEMLMGHGIGVAGSYMKPTQQEMLEEYSKATRNLTIMKSEEKVDVKNAFREQLLLVAGFKQEEIEKMDLNKIKDEELQQTIRQKLLGMMANNGSRQKVIPINEVEMGLAEGWEFIAALPDGKAILKLPF